MAIAVHLDLPLVQVARKAFDGKELLIFQGLVAVAVADIGRSGLHLTSIVCRGQVIVVQAQAHMELAEVPRNGVPSATPENRSSPLF
jgi:hypothetical protein